MDIETINKLAEQSGLQLGMYERPVLTDIGGGIIQFISSGKLTPFGEDVVMFANAIEKHVIEDADHAE